MKCRWGGNHHTPQCSSRTTATVCLPTFLVLPVLEVVALLCQRGKGFAKQQLRSGALQASTARQGWPTAVRCCAPCAKQLASGRFAGGAASRQRQQTSGHCSVSSQLQTERTPTHLPDSEAGAIHAATIAGLVPIIATAAAAAAGPPAIGAPCNEPSGSNNGEQEDEVGLGPRRRHRGRATGMGRHGRVVAARMRSRVGWGRRKVRQGCLNNCRCRQLSAQAGGCRGGCGEHAAIYTSCAVWLENWRVVSLNRTGRVDVHA